MDFYKRKSVADFQQVEDEFKRRKQEAALNQQLKRAQIENFGNGGNDPASVKIANEIQKARQSGDTQRINDLLIAGKMYDKGVVTDQYGRPVAMGGYGDAIGSIAGTKKSYEANAQNQSDLQYDPQIAGKEAQARLQQQAYYEPTIQQDIAQRKANVQLGSAAQIEEQKQRGQAQGQKQGEVSNELNERLASLPQLMDTAQKLSSLGKKATYTMTGRIGDAIRNEVSGVTGMVDPSEGAVARAEYIALVDNQILPLLRQTFGAQFTVQEGESLRATLGNVSLTPEQKDAALKSFIDQKIATIQSQQRETGQEVGQYQNPLDPLQASQNAIQQRQQEIGTNPYQRSDIDNTPQQGLSQDEQPPKKGDIIDNHIFLGGDPSQQSNWKVYK